MLISDEIDMSDTTAIQQMNRGVCLNLGVPHDKSLAMILRRVTGTSNHAAENVWRNSNIVVQDETVLEDVGSAIQRTLEESIGAV